MVIGAEILESGSGAENLYFSFLAAVASGTGQACEHWAGASAPLVTRKCCLLLQVVSLTKHRDVTTTTRGHDEQLHILPLYALDSSFSPVNCTGVQTLTTHPLMMCVHDKPHQPLSRYKLKHLKYTIGSDSEDVGIVGKKIRKRRHSSDSVLSNSNVHSNLNSGGVDDSVSRKVRCQCLSGAGDEYLFSLPDSETDSEIIPAPALADILSPSSVFCSASSKKPVFDVAAKYTLSRSLSLTSVADAEVDSDFSAKDDRGEKLCPASSIKASLTQWSGMASEQRKTGSDCDCNDVGNTGMDGTEIRVKSEVCSCVDTEDLADDEDKTLSTISESCSNKVSQNGENQHKNHKLTTPHSQLERVAKKHFMQGQNMDINNTENLLDSDRVDAAQSERCDDKMPLHCGKHNSGKVTRRYCIHSREVDVNDTENFIASNRIDVARNAICNKIPQNSGTSPKHHSEKFKESNYIQGRDVEVDDVESFLDSYVGGVAVALTHGSVMFEVANRKLHATVALQQPNCHSPTRISLEFYPSRQMNQPHRGVVPTTIESEQLVSSNLNSSSVEGQNKCRTESRSAEPVTDLSSKLSQPPLLRVNTLTTTTTVTKWIKPQPVVSGPYQCLL